MNKDCFAFVEKNGHMQKIVKGGYEHFNKKCWYLVLIGIKLSALHHIVKKIFINI